MEFKNFEHSDMRSLADLQPEGWGDITPAYQFYVTSLFCFPIKVIIANRIIAVGAAIIHNEVAWLGQIIVHPDFRNRGIGKKISKRNIALHIFSVFYHEDHNAHNNYNIGDPGQLCVFLVASKVYGKCIDCHNKE